MDKRLSECFRCPFCDRDIYINKLRIMFYYLMGKDMIVRCGYCGNRWISRVLIKRPYMFNAKLNDEDGGVCSEIFKRG